ncbi:er protein big1 [Ophiostoma piceae UAMH 11346]|uniref:Protein BIG1 n=1 Tax=Ophiostoma piceae (strain UAMH 11346) TaxID=1262450 RepID=S3BXW9_OPHP1|nr:er protein big1 [Ophiostoma piceae UAMH 11346]
MRASILAGLLAAGSAHAFTDSSPFVMFSSAELNVENTAQLQTEARVLATAKDLLASCPTSKYLVASQPGVHASDLFSTSGCEAHRLRRAAAASSVHGRFAVSEVVSQQHNMSVADFAAHIKAACATAGVDADIKELALPALPALPTCQDRAEAMGDSDYVFGNVVDEMAEDYTVVYFSGAEHDSGKYEAVFEDAAQTHIKKRIAEHHLPAQKLSKRAATAFEDKPAADNRALFEKYQFFTPGVFMSLFVFFTLLSILYVGLKAVSSLEVPYGAFDKENGPSAQKKQQ